MPLRLLPLALCLALGHPRQEEGWLTRYDLSEEGGSEARLPRALREVSGLATDERGRLFAHEDETSAVYRLDPEDGSVLGRFHVGSRALRGDFEGIAIAGERFFLITSNGILLEFAEAPDGEVAPANRRDTGLGERCELEGLAWDRATATLLAPCKTPRERALSGHLVVFSISLATLAADQRPRLLLPLGELESVGLEDRFHPSAIEVHPSSGSLFLVAAQEEALLEVSREGRPLAGRELARRRHPQPEGLAFGSDLSLLLADERGSGGGLLTRHPLVAAAGQGTGR